MASPNSPPSRYDALYRLWKMYLHMRCWGLPEHAELPEAERQVFAEAVRRGAVFRLVENCKREALAVGVELEDEWIAPLCASHLVPGEPLPIEERYRLDRVLHAMYTVLVRLDAQAPAEAQAEAQAAPGGARGAGKRSAAPGEAVEKLVAALVKHHDFDGCGCLNWEPIGVRPLARLAGVGVASAKRFFSARFAKGWVEYRAACLNRERRAALLEWLAALNGETRFRERNIEAPDDLVE